MMVNPHARHKRADPVRMPKIEDPKNRIMKIRNEEVQDPSAMERRID